MTNDLVQFLRQIGWLIYFTSSPTVLPLNHKVPHKSAKMGIFVAITPSSTLHHHCTITWQKYESYIWCLVQMYIRHQDDVSLKLIFPIWVSETLHIGAWTWMHASPPVRTEWPNMGAGNHHHISLAHMVSF